MPDETETQRLTGDEIAIALEAPLNIKSSDLLGKVKYSYSTVVQIIAGLHDVRFAFGDQLPPDGRIDPLVGVTMSHETAHRFAKALATNLQRLDKMKSMVGVGGIGQPLRMPPEIAEAANFRVLKSQGKGLYGMWIKLKDGTEKTFEGDQLTPELRTFMVGLDAATPPSSAAEKEPHQK